MEDIKGKRSQLSFKLIMSALTLAFLLLFIILNLSMYTKTKRFLISSIEDSAESLAKTLSLSVISYYLEHNYFDLKRTALKLSTQKNLVYVIFYDSEGEVIIAVKNGREWEPGAKILAFRQGTITRNLFKDKVIVVGKSIEKDGIVWGYLKFALRVDDYIGVINKMNQAFFVSILLMMAFALLFVLPLSRFVSSVVNLVNDLSDFLKKTPQPQADETFRILILEKYPSLNLFKEFNDIVNVLKETISIINELKEKEKKSALWEGTKKAAKRVVHDTKQILSTLDLTISASDILKGEEPEIPREKVNKLLMELREQIDTILGFFDVLIKYAESNLRLNAHRHNFRQEIIEKLRKIFSAKLRSFKIDLEVRLNPPEPVFVFDKYLLMRVFINLMNNAIEAIGTRGKITIEGELKEGWFIIKFSDTGPGIPSDRIGKIFEEGFTTKAQGSGFGLSIVKAIIEDLHKGRINVDSRLGQGTTFIIYLPEDPTRVSRD